MMPDLTPRDCQTCGAELIRPPRVSVKDWGDRRHCNRACRDAARPSIAVDYSVSEGGCWEWSGPIDRNGYGKAYDPKRPAGERIDWAHRVSYRHAKGAIPEGLQLDHLCNNPPCINPDHLEPVTQAENIRRAMTRAGKDDLHAEAARLRASGLKYSEIAQALEVAGRTSAKLMVEAAIRKGLVDPNAVPARRTLDARDREDIRALYALGVPQTEIGAWYGTHSSQISRICSGRTSGHDRRPAREVAA